MSTNAGADDRDVSRAPVEVEEGQIGPALRASEEGFRLLFADHPEPMWIYDLRTLAFLAVNDAAVAQYGYTRDEFLHMSIADIRPAEDAPRVRDDARRPRPALQHSGLWRHRRKDGRLIDVEITSHTLEFDGRPAVLVSARDVTERVRAEAERAAALAREQIARAEAEQTRAAALAQAAERDAVFEAMADGVFVFDRDGKIVRMNAAFQALMALSSPRTDAYSAYSLEERGARILMRDADGRTLPHELWPVSRILRGEVLTGAGMEVLIRAIDGRDVLMSVSGAPLYGRDGRISGGVCICRDVTEHRRLERRTHEALDALLAMAEASVLTAAEHDAAGAQAAGERLAELTRQVLGCRHVAIVAIDPQTERLRPVAIAGFSREDAARWWRQWDTRPRLHDRLDDAHISRLLADDVLILDRTQPPLPSDTALGRGLVLMVPLRVGAALTGVLSVDHGAARHGYTPDEVALVRAAGRLVALVIERERLLRERAEARASELALREANRRMEEFLSLAGHELRTPLTSVLGNAQLAARWVDEIARADGDAGVHSGAQTNEKTGIAERLARVATVLRRMERQGRVLSRLVQDLLDTSRIQRGQLALSPGPVDLAALIREVVEEARQRAPRRSFLLDLPGEAVPVVADGERITQVLDNYLSNALKFSADDQPVAIGVRRDESAVCVWVRDAGPGLPAAEHERVWERFYRADTMHRDGSSVGLGLGLYISRSIVERHAGRVGVDSAPGEGATFWFTLPRAPLSTASSAARGRGEMTTREEGHDGDGDCVGGGR